MADYLKVGDIGAPFGDSDSQQAITAADLVRAGLIEQSSIGPEGRLLGREAVRLGGFLMGADYIRDVANSFGLASTVTAGDDVRFWAGATFANRASAPFRLTEAGALVATSATITGTITATTGTIGGFTVGADYIINTANTFGLSSATAGDSNARIWTGASLAGKESAPFRVNNTGELYAYTATARTLVSTVTTGSPPIYVNSTTLVDYLHAATADSVPASGLTGNTLAAGVTASSLTSVGTLSTLTVTATITGSVSGSAATLATGRTFNGSSSFNGSGNVTDIHFLASQAGSGGATTSNGIYAYWSGGVLRFYVDSTNVVSFTHVAAPGTSTLAANV